jgi:ComF family protein
MAVSGFYFQKGSLFQKLIFKLKYHRLPQVGVTLGHFYGHYLRSSSIMQGVEAIIPIPLHFQKLQKKGYNHAERIAYGIAQAANIPLDEHGLKRIKNTQTQTKLNAEERLQNVSNAFECKTKFRQSVILIDDVLTTGATLSSAVQILHEAGVGEVRVITLGIAGLR